MSILKLIRWKNLLLIALTQVLIKYALLEPFASTTTLSNFEFFLLVLSSVCLAAAGNIINDIHDIEIDRINKPEKVIVGKAISEKTAYNLFFALNIIGVSIGFYLAMAINKGPFFSIFAIISILLYIYSSFLKQMLLVGNLVVSVLVAFTILLVGLFELLPAITKMNQSTQFTFFKILFDYSVFAFMINFLREIVKDIEDVDGDYKEGIQSLPIVLGRERAAKIAFLLSFIPLAAIVYYTVTYLYHQQLAAGYFLMFLIAPMIYVSIKLFNAETKKQFHHISKVLKLVMLFGILSLLLYKFILPH